MLGKGSVGRSFFAVWALVLLVGVTLPVGFAQVPAKKAAPPMPKPGAPPVAGKGKSKLPEPELVSLETKDGVTIKATYYAGAKSKDTVPVILIHGFGGQRSEFHGFALQLQALGHSAIAPDLRGHGQSTTRKSADGSAITLSSEKLIKRDLEDMVLDVEACKKFLLDKNNASEVNIELLTVVGAEFGSILAVRWAAADWAVRDLPSYKQGRDVKALVLLSPMASFKAVTMREALASPAIQRELSMMLISGTKDSKSTAEAKKMNDALQRFQAKLPDDQEERRKVQKLYLVQPEVALAGTKLLADTVFLRDLTIKEMINIFIDRRLVQRKGELMWQDRQSPL